MGMRWGALTHGREQSNSSGLGVHGSLPLASVVLRPPQVTLEPSELVRIRGEAARIVCSASDVDFNFELILQRGNTEVSPWGDSRVTSAHLPTTSHPAGRSPSPTVSWLSGPRARSRSGEASGLTRGLTGCQKLVKNQGLGSCH